MQFLTHYKKTIALVLAVTMALLSPMTSFAESGVTAKDSFGSMIEDILPGKEILVEKDIALGTEDAAQDKSVSAETVTDIKNVLTDIASENDTGFAESEQDFIACSDPVDGIVVTVKAKAGVLPATAKVVVEKIATESTTYEDIEAAVDNTKIIDGTEDETGAQPAGVPVATDIDSISNPSVTASDSEKNDDASAFTSELSTKRNILDITILDEDGNEIEPDGEVEIKFTLTEAVANLTGIRVFHAEDSIEKLTKIAEKIEKAEAEGIESELEFPDGEVFDDVNQKAGKKDIQKATEKFDALLSDYSAAEGIAEAEEDTWLIDTPYVAEELEVVEPPEDASAKAETAVVNIPKDDNTEQSDALPVEFSVITDSFSAYVIEFSLSNIKYSISGNSFSVKDVLKEMNMTDPSGITNVWSSLTDINPGGTAVSSSGSGADTTYTVGENFISGKLTVQYTDERGEEHTVEISITRNNFVACIDSRNYASLQEALNAVRPGETIEITSNIILTDTAAMKKSYDDAQGIWGRYHSIVTIDLNGYEIKGELNDKPVILFEGVNVTIKDSSENSEGKIENTSQTSQSNVVTFRDGRIRWCQCTLAGGTYTGRNVIFNDAVDFYISTSGNSKVNLLAAEGGYALSETTLPSNFYVDGNNILIDGKLIYEDGKSSYWKLSSGTYTDKLKPWMVKGTGKVPFESKDKSGNIIYTVEPASEAAVKNMYTGLEYHSLEAAIDLAAEGDLISLQKDLSGNFPIAKTVSVDLNGKTLYDAVITVTSGNVKFMNGVLNGSLVASGESTDVIIPAMNMESGSISAQNGAKISISGGTYGSITLSENNGIIEISGGRFANEISPEYVAPGYIAIQEGDYWTVTSAEGNEAILADEIHGVKDYGTLPAMIATASDGDIVVIVTNALSEEAIKANNGKDFSIDLYGKTIKKNLVISDNTKLYLTDGTLDGSITVVDGSKLFIDNEMFVKVTNNLTVSGTATLSNANAYFDGTITGDGDVQISAGYFKYEPDDKYLAEGYKAVKVRKEDKYYTIVPVTVKVTTTSGTVSYFEDLQTAAKLMNASSEYNGATIELLKDVTDHVVFRKENGINNEYILSLGNYSLRATEGEYALGVVGAKVTLKSGTIYGSETASGAIAIENYGTIIIPENSDIKINGKMLSVDPTIGMSISGGYYADPPENNLESGFAVFLDSKYKEFPYAVKRISENAAAYNKQKNTYYVSLKDAVSDAGSNQTISLFKSVYDAEEKAEVKESITFDFGSFVFANGNIKVSESGHLDIVSGSYKNITVSEGKDRITVKAGLFDNTSRNSFADSLDSGLSFISNTDAATKTDFPWTVGTAEVSIIRGSTTTEYASISDAVNDMSGGDELRLLKDITLENGKHLDFNRVPAYTTISLNLNGHTLSGQFDNGGLLTFNMLHVNISDSTGTGKIWNKSTSGNSYAIYSTSGSYVKMRIYGGIIEGANAIYLYESDVFINETRAAVSVLADNADGYAILFNSPSAEINIADSGSYIPKIKGNIEYKDYPVNANPYYRIQGGMFTNRIKDNYLYLYDQYKSGVYSERQYRVFFNPDDNAAAEYPYTVYSVARAKSELVNTSQKKDIAADAVSTAAKYAQSGDTIRILQEVTDNSIEISANVTLETSSKGKLGGELKAKGPDAGINISTGEYSNLTFSTVDGGSVNITGGKFDSVSAEKSETSINITGGLFKIAPDASYIADGYGVQNNPDTASDYKYTIVNIAEAEAYVRYVSIPGSDIRIYYPKMTDAIYGAEAGSTVYQIVQETLISPLEKDVLASGIVLNRNTMRIKEASTLSLGKDVRISNGTITGGSSGISLLAVKGKTIFEDINFIADTPIYWGSENADVEIHGGVHEINRFISGTSGYWKEDKPVLSIYDGQFALNDWFFTGYPGNDYVHIQLYGGDYSISPDAQSTHDVIRIGEGRGIVKNAADATYPWSVATLSEADCEAKLPKEHCIYEKEEDAGIYYRTIGTAFSDVRTTKTVTLCKDVNLSETVAANCADGGTITLDLNGKAINCLDTDSKYSVAENTTLKIISSIKGGSIRNFGTVYPPSGSKGGTIIFDGANVKGYLGITKYTTEIKSGKWWIDWASRPTPGESEQGEFKISGGKFRYNTWDDKDLLKSGCYFFNNPDDDKNDYPYLVDKGYTVSFVLNGHGGEIAPVTARAGHTLAAPATPSDVSYSFDGWFKESGCENRWNFDTDTVKSNMTLYAKWAIKKYTASFDMQGHGAQITSQSVAHGGKIAEPPTPSETGYLFDGWFTKDGTGSDWGEKWNFEENTVTADITLHAKWTEAEASLKKQGESTAVYFASLSDAMDVAGDGSTVALLKNITIPDENNLLWKSSNSITVTLDLNGKTITGNYAGPLLDIENIKLSIIDSSAADSGESAGTIENKSDSSSAYVLRLMTQYGWIPLKISAGNYIGYNGIEFKDYNIDLSNLNITAQGNALKDTQNIVEDIAISSGRFKGSITVRSDFDKSYGKITGGLFTHKLDSRLYAGNSALHRQFRSGDADYPYTVDKSENAAAENYSDIDKNIEGLGYYSLSRAVSDASANAKIRVLKPVRSDTEISSSDIEITGDIEVKDSALLEIKAGKYDGVLSKDESARINITGGAFKNAPKKEYIAEGYGVKVTGEEYPYIVLPATDIDGEAIIHDVSKDVEYYVDTLKNAIASPVLEDGDSITLRRNATIDNTSCFDKSITLNLAGNTLNGVGTTFDIPVKASVSITNGKVIQNTDKEKDLSFFKVHAGGNLSFDDVDLDASSVVIFWDGENGDTSPSELYIHGGNHNIKYIASSVYSNQNIQGKAVIDGGYYPSLTDWRFKGDKPGTDFKDYLHVDLEIRGGSFNLNPDYEWKDNKGTGKVRMITIASGKGIIRNIGNSEYPWSVATLSEADCEAKLPKEHCIYEKEEDAGIYYRTIGTALNDVHKTKTVTLCKDATLKETVVASCSDAEKTITLDLNGKKLTSSDKQTISVAEDTTLIITSSNENGTFTNFTTGNSAGGKIIFENVNVEGSVRLLDCETEIKSGKWKISTMSLPSIESGKLRISGGKFNTRLSEGYLATGCYFFENPDADRNDYQYLVDQGYTVSFVLNGHGGEMAPVTARAEHTLAAPATPSDVSYLFDGWFKESGCANRWNFDTDPVESDMTLYAKWTIKKYTASFDMHGHGAQIASRSVAHGGKIAEPSTPSESGYLFDGWFKEDGTESGNWGNQWSFEKDTVTADITLHAKWTEAEAYRINSGSAEKIYFASLSEAVNTASDGSTVYVLKDGIIVGGDSATGEQLTFKKTFTLDLNGKTLVSRFPRVVGQGKTITIQNGTVRSSGGDNDAGLFRIDDYNTSLVLNNVNTYGDRIAALSCDRDVLTINGGFHKGHTIISANGNGSNQKIRISSGDFELDTWMYDDDNVHNYYTADVTGGNFKLESWKGKSSADSNCKINIEGGNYNLSPDQTFATIKTDKGIIRNVEDAVYPWSVGDISACVASVPNISRVNNDTIYYRTIRDALADADRTETITLLKTVSLADRVYIGDEESHRYTVTIDLAGHTFRTTKGGTIGIIGIASGSVAKFDNSSASRAIIENLYMDTFGSGRIEFAESIDFAGALDLNNHRAIITGGRWNISEMGANPKLSIIGGKFNNDYSEYLAEGTQARFYKNTDEDQNTYRYIVDERHYTVSFDLQGHGEPQPATLSVIPMATISTPSAVSEEGYEFGGWFREPECASRWNFDTDPVESDMTLYAKWVKKNYNVYFNMNGHGEQVDTQPVSYGELVIEPETPQEEGYTFGGWFRDRTFDNAWNFTTDPVKSNMTLHAKWDQNKYEVSFDRHDHGPEIATQSVAHGGKITEPPTPSETGYLFDGWFKEDGTESGNWGNQWSFENDTVTAAVTLHAKWTESAAAVIDSQNTTYYRTAEEAFAAAQNGDTVKLLKPFEVTEALTVNHSITLDLNGQILSGNDDRYIIAVENAGFTVTDTSISKEGKIENKSSDPNSYAVILTADDKTNEYAFTMTGGTISGYNGVVSDWNYHALNISGGYISASGIEYSTSLSWWNSVVSLNISDGYFKGSVEYAGAGSMTSYGNITGGYYSDKSARSYMAKGCGVLDNKDEATEAAYPYTVGQAFRVEFELNGHGDTYYDVQYVANGGKVVKPEDPTEKGYTFDGWYTKNGMIDPETKTPDWGELWNFETDTIIKDTTLYAKWSATFYTVTFDLHGYGGYIQPIGYPYGSKVVEPEKPYEKGWVFSGWFKEDGSSTGNWGEKWNFEKDIVTAGITLHAKWDEAEASVKSGETTEYYTSLTAALASASDADTVTLYKTVEAASTIVIDKNITLDLNGFNISGDLTDYVIKADGTSLKITDSSTGDKGSIVNGSTSGNSYAVALFGDETVKDDTLIETAAIDTLTIEGVAIEGYNAIWSDFNYDGIEMTSGSITARADGIAAGFWNNCMKLAISGGEIKGMLSYEGAGGIADGYTGAITGGIYSKKPDRTFINPEYGVADTGDTEYRYKVVELKKTSYKVTYDAQGGLVKTEEMTIPVETVTVEGIPYGSMIPPEKCPVASWNNKVLDGWYTEPKPETGEPSSECRAWDFNKDVVTEDMTLYAWWSDGVAEVTFKEQGASTTTTVIYKNFHDAVNAAEDKAKISDTTLKLLANADIVKDHVYIKLDGTSPATLTFDLNGKTLSGGVAETALLEFSGNGTLVITGENGGYLTSDNGNAIYVDSGNLRIQSGHFKGSISFKDSISRATLYGGEYDRKNDATLETGYSWVYRPSEKEYPYAVVPDTDKVASYTWMTEGQGGEQIEHTEYFAAFEDAVAFANTKDTGDIELLKDYHKDTTYILYQDVTVYLNNHTLSSNTEKQALITAVGSNLAVSGGARVSAMTGTDRTDEKGGLSNTASGTVISMSDPSKKLSIGSGRYQGSIVYENVQQGQKPAGDIYGGIYSEAPGKKEIFGVISSEGYLREGYEVTDNTDTETKTTYPKQVSIRKFTVTFNTLNGGVKVDPQHIKYGQKATEVTPYVKDLAFEGWFEKDGTSTGDWGTKWSFDNEIKSDVELFAKWSHAVAALEHAGETKNYNSIADAVAAANAFTEGTAALTLLGNCDINATLAFDLKTGLTVDLKGKNLTGSIAGGSLISKSGSGKLTITDSADKTAYGLINNTGLKGGSISVGQGDAEINAGKIRGAMSAAASQEKTGNITLAGGLYDSEAYASVNGTAVKLADGYVWLNRTEGDTYPYEVISGTELAATYTLNSRTVTFNSLESAVSYVNANAGGTLKLENSYPLSGQTAKALEFAGNITLDLNGKSITVNESTAAVKSEGKISILDSSSAKNGSINNNSGSALEVKFVSETSKDIIISGGNFQGAVRYYNVPGSKTDMPDYKVEVVADIYGGAFSADPTKVYDTHVTANVLREGYGVTDNGLGTYRYIVGINNYTVTFNGKGGTFTETGKTDNLIKNYKHGDTIGQQPEIKNSDNTKLFDGWFTKDGTIEKTSTGAPDWGKKWNFSTDKIISNMTLYAKWGGRIAVIMRDGKELSFSSIQDAVDAALPGEIVKVLDNVTVYEPIVITGKKLILDLGGHTITANPASKLSGAVQITGGDVTVKNGKVINNAGTAVKTKDGTVVLSGLTVTSAAAAALSVDGGAMTVTGSTVTGTTGITVNPSASGSGAAKTVTLKVEGGSRITGTTNDGINSFKAEYGTPETGGKVDLKLNNSTINGKDCGIKMQGVDEFDCVSDASTCVSEGDYAIDPGSAEGDFNWNGGSLEAVKEIFVISGAVAITVSISYAFLKAKAMMSLKKAALIAGCTIAAVAITVSLFELLFNSGNGNKPKYEMVRIEYDSKGGSAVPEAFYVPKGTVITVEKLPGKGSGSECKGWRCDANNLLYRGGESYTASKDTLFTAEYRYKVTFDTGNTDAKKITSKVPDAQWIDEGGKARKPVPSEYTPIDKNYVLSSWKDGNADFNFETTVINKPYNLKANWKDRASVKVTARLKNDPTQLKVDWSRNYKTLYEALSEANKPYNEIAEKALEKDSLDQVDISITVTLLDNFISSLNAQPVSGQPYGTYDVKNDMTLNLADYDISEHLVDTAVFTVDSGSTLSVKGAGAIYSLKTAFKVNDDLSTQKGGGVNITAGAITAATNVISFNQYGAFSISGGTVEASGDNGNVVYVDNPQTGKITGGITGGYISGGTNIPKPASEEDKLNITGGFYTEKAKTAFDNVGLPAGYCWKKSGLASHPWTIDKGRVVKFDAKGGIPAPEDQTVSIGERVIKPAAMTNEGFTFDAWYTKDGTVNKDAAGNPDWGEKWAFETRTIADTDPNPLWLYAKWDGAVARVDYHADVTGAVKNPTYHASVKAAFDTANADAAAYQITLIKDAQIVTGEEAVAQKLDGITGTKNYTFDLGTHTLSIGLTAESLRAAITVGQGIDITVKNGEIEGTGRLFDNGAELTLADSISIKGITDDLIFEQNGPGSYTEFKSGTFTALKLEPSAGSITLTGGKYAHIIYEPKNTSPACSINGGVYDGDTKDYIEAKRALLYKIILNPYKPCWVTNTDGSTKYLYPWTLGKVVAVITKPGVEASEPKYYGTLQSAIDDSTAGETITLLASVSDADEGVAGYALKAGTTLDLDGHDITTQALISNDAELKDSKESAMIKVSTISQLTVKSSNTQLPVYDNVKGGYRLFGYKFFARGVQHAKPSEGQTMHAYKLEFTGDGKAEGYKLLAQGSHGLGMVVNSRYRGSDDTEKTLDINFVSPQKDTIKKYGQETAAGGNRVLQATFRAKPTLPHDRTISSTAVLTTACGIRNETPKAITSRFYTQQQVSN